MTRVFLSRSRDVFTNLAAEEWLLWNGPESCLLLYRNAPAVVIGRNQNPWKEADLHFLSGARIPLARRLSGGGTVYHDLGNLNYSFLQPRDSFSKHLNAKTLSDAIGPLLRTSIAQTTRGDIVVHPVGDSAAPRKFSGTAYRMSRDRVCHHGTILINSHLPTLRAALKASSEDFELLECMGTRSVPAQVANLAALGKDDVLDVHQVVRALARHVGAEEPEDFEADMICVEEQNAADTRSKLTSYKWIVGETPKFTARFHVPEPTRLTLDVAIRKGGVISDVAPPSPVTGLESGTFANLQSGLTNCDLNPVAVAEAVRRGKRAPSDELATLAQWFRAKVPPVPTDLKEEADEPEEDDVESLIQSV